MRRSPDGIMMSGMEQLPDEQQEQIPVRNLLSNPADTIRAIAEVEGPTWFSTQDAIEKRTVSEGEYETSLPHALERLGNGKPSTVYGKGGVNRWYIEPDGSVSFSETHAESAQHLKKARELGFVIVP